MSYYKSNRCLSPHLFLYKYHITSLLSIFHRITGFCCSFLLLFYPIFFITLSSFFSFDLFYSICFFLSIIKDVFFSLLFYIFMYHIVNGIRHILWDLGLGLNMYGIVITGFLISFLSLFLICLIIVF
jgi:succinate dehydrogenase / fumarate reductase cytochrome b subunit